MPPNTELKGIKTDIVGISLALNDVEDGYVATLFARRRRYHPTLGL